MDKEQFTSAVLQIVKATSFDGFNEALAEKQAEVLWQQVNPAIVRSALQKYIEHVECREGTAFLSDNAILNSEIIFTQRELELLRTI